MTPEQFGKLTNNQKWELIWGNKITDVLWCCASCGHIVDGGLKPISLVAGGRYCGNCDSLLTRRTGGGQNMPCNYTFIPNRKLKLKKIIENIDENKNGICQ
jgi:hypothetical protein